MAARAMRPEARGAKACEHRLRENASGRVADTQEKYVTDTIGIGIGARNQFECLNVLRLRAAYQIRVRHSRRSIRTSS
jgi:hypothetical protein